MSYKIHEAAAMAGVTVRTLRVRVKKLTQARDSLGTGEENGGN